jgi:outer membrane lipopolysaccharide assembly protein LptE/RlpB
MRRPNSYFSAIVVSFFLVIGGCGYHTVGAASHLPSTVHTLAVPTFVNRSQSFHTEVAMTQAVIRELTARTAYTIVSTNAPNGPNKSTPDEAKTPGEATTATTTPSAADATVHGVILTEAVSPLTYNSQTGQSSSFLITVTAKVTVTDRNDRVLYENARYSFRQQYQSSSDLASFIEEDPAAIARLSKDFAQSLVGDILESF